MQLANSTSLHELLQEACKRLKEIDAKEKAGELTHEDANNAREQANDDYAKARHQLAIHRKRACELRYRGELEWGKIRTPEDWEKLLAQSRCDYEDGRFFLQRIGRMADVDPVLVATLLELRQAWITDYQIETAPEFLLVDMALCSHFHFLRFNELMSNLEMQVEWELFGLDQPKLRYDESGTIPKELRVEHYAARLQTELLPQLDRLNRMFLRSLKALRDLKRANVELHIGQVNIGEKQVNIAGHARQEQKEGR
ncbi:hypothetical protein HYR54_15575 [Candidatus Acetothermia bacterium]|nr:hypothetical protein [Candidatus Acetothermia bacterium]